MDVRSLLVHGGRVLDKLAPIIEEQVARRDTRHDVFHGCIDWHSAVHGHWALLRIARVLERPELAARVDALLDPRKIAAEAKWFDRYAEFEMPYGRAWFLRLAVEHGRFADTLRPMASALAATVRAYYTARKPSPDTYEYDNASWAFAQLHAWYVHTADATGLAFIHDHLATSFAEPPKRAFSDDADEFFSLAGNWLYLIASAAPERLATAVAAAKLGDLEPRRELARTAHGLGLNWSRAWCLAKLARVLGDARYRTAFDAHVAVGKAHHDKKADDVWAYRHWVPQFAVYALTVDHS
jgi:hypothetical protein